jgi:hypothetical protein
MPSTTTGLGAVTATPSLGRERRALTQRRGYQHASARELRAFGELDGRQFA